LAIGHRNPRFIPTITKNPHFDSAIYAILCWLNTGIGIVLWGYALITFSSCCINLKYQLAGKGAGI